MGPRREQPGTSSTSCRTARRRPVTSSAQFWATRERRSACSGSPRTLPGQRQAIFIWDIEIDPRHRGQGHGRAALEALEPIARSLGYDEIELHTFGDNEVARNLYRSAGYREVNVSMVKRLG